MITAWTVTLQIKKLLEDSNFDDPYRSVVESICAALDTRVNKLKGGRMRNIGSGVFGAVYNHSKLKNIVFKVFDGDESVDYLRFAKYCASSRNKNPHLPKVHNIVYGNPDCLVSIV